MLKFYQLLRNSFTFDVVGAAGKCALLNLVVLTFLYEPFNYLLGEVARLEVELTCIWV
jgi:hypothetical protein